ncbi:MAG TPA: amino acid permease [Candidatus Binatia bacterium]|nr:amino acid permease [Candidatus Binatia bacterium]
MDSAAREVAPPQPAAVKPHLGLWDIVSIILGIVIGAGIYETAPFIFQNVSSPAMGLMVWLAGGILTFIGGLCYAELASTYPRSGGDYVYLTKAFGRWAGFLFGWMQLAVLMTGSIGMMAYIFADYAVTLRKFGPASEFIYATAAVSGLSIANLVGLVFGRRTQNFLTGLKVLAIGSIVIAGFFWTEAAAAKAPIVAGSGSLGLAMILVLYTYGGWNDAALVAAEVVDKPRNLPLAFMLGTGSLMLVYLLVNGAYLNALGFQGARESKAIAADVLARPFGTFGAKAMAIFVMVSALGALNGMIYTGSRIYASLGEDYPALNWLSRWHPRRSVPVLSMLMQTAITLFLVALVGTNWGRNLINALVSLIGFEPLSWQGHGGFETLLRSTAPVFWAFFLMTGISVFVLRVRDSNTLRLWKVPLYPLTPLIFCAMCAYMLYSAYKYAGKLLVIGVVPVLIGLIFYWFARRSAVKPSPNQP